MRACSGRCGFQLADQNAVWLVSVLAHDDQLLLHVGGRRGYGCANKQVAVSRRCIAERSGDLIAFGRDYIANPDLAERYFQILLHARHLRTVALSPAIAAEAARVRADFQMKTPDAIQLATAKESGATSFVTNDGELASIPGLRVIVLEQVRRGSQV